MPKPQAKRSLDERPDFTRNASPRPPRSNPVSGEPAWDAAERARAAQALHDSEARFRQLAEASSNVLWIVDAQAQRLEYLSPAFERIWGEPRDAVLARLSRWSELVHPDDRERVQQGLPRLLAGETLTQEYRILRSADGAVRWIRDTGFPISTVDGRIVRLGGIAQDVTDAKAIEQALAESEARFRQFADASPDVLWIRDADTLAMEYVSPAFEQIYGVPRDTVLGDGDPERWVALLDPEDRQVALADLDRLRAGERVTHEFRVRRASDRRVRWIRNTDFALRDVAGRVVRIGGIGQDVTALKRSEQRLRDADRRKDEFLAMLAHELRNPLAPLANAHRLLERTERLSEQGRSLLAMAERQTRQLQRLVDDLLEVNRITRGAIELRCEPMLVGSAVYGAVESVSAQIEARSQHLELALPAEPRRIVADPARIAQILENLLINASKYTPPEGTIRIEVVDRGADIEIRVRDTGVGIDPSKLSQLFEFFSQIDVTLDRAQGGLGIGLALVKRLVELHGGTVAAESGGVGRGATFIVRLPRIGSG